MWRLFSAFYKRYCGGWGGEADVKIKEETEGSGATVKAEAAAVAGPAPAITVPAARAQAAAAAVTARVATAVGRPGFSRCRLHRGQSGESLSLPSSEQAHSFHSFTLASQRQLTGCSLPGFGNWQSRCSFSALLANDTRSCSCK